MKLLARLSLGWLLGISLCVLGCVVIAMTANDGEQLPIRSMRVTIDEYQRDVLFEEFRKFAEKHDFEILIRDSGLSGELFQVYMSRQNIEIISRNPFDPSIFRVGLYNKNPSLPIPQETADELFNDLKAFISEIPGVTIAEE